MQNECAGLFQCGFRGRFGKSFFSPENTGIYLSIFRKLDLDENDHIGARCLL